MRSGLILCAALAAAGVASHAFTAEAGGLYVTDRGVRPLGRGGAYVAGADDEHAVWYNPAGLALSNPGALLDFSLPLYSLRYTREVLPCDGADQSCSGTQPIRQDPVSAGQVPIPIPTVVVSHNFGQQGFMFAAGVFGPNAVLEHFPDTDTAPQRYTLITMEGSTLAVGGLWAAYAPNKHFSAGLGLQAMFGEFDARVALSGCPATITCQPEDPEWDTVAQLKATPIFAPSGNLGVRISPVDQLAIGLSFQLPFWISAPTTVHIRLPSSPYFDGARVEGDRANVSFTMPAIFRAGVEVRPVPEFRAELAFVYEAWQMQDGITLSPTRDSSQPNGIQITNVRGVGTYDVGETKLPRGLQGTYSVRLGGEYDLKLNESVRVIPRLGLAYETSSQPLAYTSVLAFDTNKFLLSVGASLAVGRSIRLDLLVAESIGQSVCLAASDARIYQVAPFRADPSAPTHAINGGCYENNNVTVLGLGARYAF